MAAGKRIYANVIVDGTFYKADTEVPAEVAEKITNPAVWDSSDQTTAATDSSDEEPQSQAGSTSRRSRRSS